MWATSTLSCRLWPPTTTGGTQGPFTVSARYSRPRKNIKYDYDDDELDNQRELDMLKQQEIGESEDASATAAPKAKISGSVVLMALQKASAEKSSKKIKKKMMNNKSKIMKDGEVRRQGDASADYRNVKPLCIKSDWKDRLDELESQLHQLIHNA